MKDVYVMWKDLGETPLEALTRLSDEQAIEKDVPLTYAGRLDPAAEGLLIILAGEECKKKEDYTKLPKTYLVEILIGVSTDSFDLLGIPKAATALNKKLPGNPLLLTEEFLTVHIGKHTQTYPPYSSKTVDGTQLHEHTRNGTEIELPTHEVELISFDDVTIEDVLSEDVLIRVGELTTSVTGDFRQKEIVEAWADLPLPEKIQMISVTLNVGSGFYVRQFAEDLGKHLGIGACLHSLIRTQIGDYKKAQY